MRISNIKRRIKGVVIDGHPMSFTQAAEKFGMCVNTVKRIVRTSRTNRLTSDKMVFKPFGRKPFDERRSTKIKIDSIPGPTKWEQELWGCEKKFQ